MPKKDKKSSHNGHPTHHQWQAYANAKSNLDNTSVITIEGYQQNLEVAYGEHPTSKVNSSNKLTVAIYPICSEYVDYQLQLHKGGIVFISDDKKHDFQQIDSLGTECL